MHVNYQRGGESLHVQIHVCNKVHCSVITSCLLSFHSELFSSLDEEDDVISYHDLVVVLHTCECGSDLGLLERSGSVLVDVSHQSVHAH